MSHPSGGPGREADENIAERFVDLLEQYGATPTYIAMVRAQVLSPNSANNARIEGSRSIVDVPEIRRGSWKQVATALGTALARIGGADLRILSAVPSARSQFIQIGLSLLSAGAIAFVSMWFALQEAFRASWWITVLVSLMWGFWAFSIHQILVRGVRSETRGIWAITAVVSRTVIVVFLAIVTATPLVLRVFRPEILANLAETHTNDAGLLAQIEALDRISDQNNVVRWARWIVTGLLVLVSLLPALTRYMTGRGPASLYDRVRTLQEESLYEFAVASRRSDRHRVEWATKLRMIEDDMYARETHLGARANAHVASEMERILDLAIAQWSAQTTRGTRTPNTDAEDRSADPAERDNPRPGSS